MAFKDLTDVLGMTPPKTLPIHGVSVEFPATISARSGQMLIAIAASARSKGEAGVSADDIVASLHLTEQDAAELESDLLGESGAKALDDLGVIGNAREHVINTLIAWHLRGESAAEGVWNGTGKAKGPTTSKPRAGRGSKTAGGAAGRSRAGAGASSGRRTAAATTSRRGSRSAGAS